MHEGRLWSILGAEDRREQQNRELHSHSVFFKPCTAATVCVTLLTEIYIFCVVRCLIILILNVGNICLCDETEVYIKHYYLLKGNRICEFR
jgi:hypothetical protein